MDILSGERTPTLEYRYLGGRGDAEDSVDVEEDFFSIEVEDTCLVALTTAYNAREAEGGITKQELLQFVEECFKQLPADKLKELKVQAKTRDKPELQLVCKVLRASGLTAKDANGLSDPYCLMGILNEMHREKNIVKHKNLENWQKDELVECVAGTKVKQATLEPEWNEDFYLSVTEPSKEMLVLEVWDSDEPAETGGTKIKGIKGFGTYLAEKTIHKGDDFMGRVFYPLRSIPNSGEEKTLLLHSHSGKTQHGYVTLQLSVGAKRKKTPLKKHLSDFSALSRALVNFSAKKDGHYTKRWSGQLPPAAEKLLEHYALLNSVEPLHQTCIRLSVLIRYHKLYDVNLKVVCDLIRKIKDYRTSFSELAYQNDSVIKQLFTDLSELSEEIKGVLMKHLSMFNVTSSSDVAKIEERVKTLCELFCFSPFVERLPSGGGSLKATLEDCVRAATQDWFRVVDAHLLPKVDTSEEQLLSFVSLSEHCLDQCQRTFKYLNPIFLEAGIDYFSCFFVSLDKLLCADAEQKLKGYRSSHSSGVSTFVIYRSFKDMVDMMKYVNKRMCGGLEFPHFHNWFKDMVQAWIKMATDKCKDYTVKAIAADSSFTVTNDVMFSTSALDTTGFLLQVGSFWKHLEWPVASVAYGHAVSVMEGISECALFYVGEVFKKLRREDIFDEKGRFRATEKLCIILNNMQHIRQELSKFEETLQLQSFYDWLDREEKAGQRCKELVGSLLESADEDIFNKMNKIMLQITEKLSPDIQRFVHNLIGKETSLSDEEAIDPLLEFLHRNLQTFVSHLYPDVLKIILRHMWQVSVDSVEKCLEETPLKKGTDSAKLHQRLFTTLKTMRDFYHCGGDGLQDKELDSELYKALLAKLDILRLPTDKLILRFFSELAQNQAKEIRSRKNELGTLLVSVGYSKKNSVEVDIIQGNKLPGLDKTGLSDPFVELTLMPVWAFADQSNKVVKTSVQKQTLDPFFNESFKLPAKLSEMDVEGTVLLLSVFDHDIVGANDFAGMCVVACKDIPRLASPEESLMDPRSPQKKNMTLPLFHYAKATPAFVELDARAHLGDAKAADFFKMNKYHKLLGNLAAIDVTQVLSTA